MKGSSWIRLIIIGAIWLWLCGMIIVRAQPVTLWTIFVIIASGIIVFVPLYKKYKRNDTGKK